jgi:hypothetical protein
MHEALFNRAVDMIFAVQTCEAFLASGRILDNGFIDLESHLWLPSGYTNDRMGGRA